MPFLSKNNSFARGQSLIEIVIALGVFLIVAIGSVVLAFRYVETLNRARAMQKAEFILRSSFEAVQSIGYGDWVSLVNGTYGLSNAGGTYQLVADPDVLENTYTRTVTIDPVNRDAACNGIVSSGGIVDNDTKAVRVRLDWSIGGSQQKTYSQYITRYFSTPSELSGCTPTQASSVYAYYSGSAWYSSSKTLTNLFFYNMSSNPLVIDKVRLTWSLPGNIISADINGEVRWNSTGTGSPSGPQASGTELNIVNHTLPPNNGHTFSGVFDSNLATASFTATLIMGDGSSLTTNPFTPFVY